MNHLDKRYGSGLEIEVEQGTGEEYTRRKKIDRKEIRTGM